MAHSVSRCPRSLTSSWECSIGEMNGHQYNPLSVHVSLCENLLIMHLLSLLNDDIVVNYPPMYCRSNFQSQESCSDCQSVQMFIAPNSTCSHPLTLAGWLAGYSMQLWELMNPSRQYTDCVCRLLYQTKQVDNQCQPSWNHGIIRISILEIHQSVS